MTVHLGNVPASSTLYIPFATYAGSTGASATCTGLAVTDIEIYKNGSVTQRASDAGYTLLDTDGIDFDGITGIHGFSIDLSDNTDAGFFSVGGFYWVVVSAITVDSQTVNFIAATFRIAAAEAITGKPKVDVDGWLGTACATPTVNGVPEVDLTHVAGANTNVSALATNVDAILTDTNITLQAELDGIQADTEDIQSRLPAALTANGNMKSSLLEIITTALTEGAAGRIAAAWQAAWNVASSVWTSASVNQTGDSFARIGATGSGLTTLATSAALGTLQTDVTTIKGHTDDIGVAGAGLGSIPWNPAWDAEVQSEVQDAIEVNHLDHLLAADYDPAAKPGVATALLNEIIGSDAGVSQFTANALELGPGGGSGLDAAGVRAAIGMDAADLDDQLDAILAAATAGAGAGAYTLTVTVNDGTDPLQNAIVRLTEGINTFFATTNASGVATFSVNAATYDVAITKDGYSFTPTTKVVSGTGSQTYSMTAVTITPSAPGQVTGYLTVYDEDGVIEADADVHIQQLQPVSGSGIAYDGTTRTETSGVNGVVEFSGMFPGGRYRLWRGTDENNAVKFTLAANATDPVELSSIVGNP